MSCFLRHRDKVHQTYSGEELSGAWPVVAGSLSAVAVSSTVSSTGSSASYQYMTKAQAGKVSIMPKLAKSLPVNAQEGYMYMTKAQAGKVSIMPKLAKSIPVNAQEGYIPV
jgi:hypothetical protein